MIALKTEIIFGFHPVREALAAGRRTLFEMYLARGKKSGRAEELVQACEKREIPVKRIEPAQLSGLAGTAEHQGVGARVSALPEADLNGILGKVADGLPPFLLILDQIVDPRNLGALVRTALGVGMMAVIVPRDRSAPSSPAASKASAGAMEHMPVVRATNLVRTIHAIKEKGVWVAGLDRRAKQGLFETDLTGPLAIAVGAEEKGLRPLVRSACDFLISIPQMGPLDSLNASVAGAAAMYEAFRQRGFATGGRKT